MSGVHPALGFEYDTAEHLRSTIAGFLNLFEQLAERPDDPKLHEIIRQVVECDPCPVCDNGADAEPSFKIDAMFSEISRRFGSVGVHDLDDGRWCVHPGSMHDYDFRGDTLAEACGRALGVWPISDVADALLSIAQQHAMISAHCRAGDCGVCMRRYAGKLCVHDCHRGEIQS